MRKFFEVRWHGRGGQGTVTGAKSLSEAVQGTGKYVAAFPEYGPERRGAPLRAFNRFADKMIRIHTPVQNPDVVIVVDPTLIGSPDLLEGITPDTIFIVNTEKSAENTKQSLSINSQKLHTVPANKISFQLFNKEIPNSALMGTFAKACGNIISIDKLLEESEQIFAKNLGSELVDRNLEAIKKGYESGEEI